MSRISEIVIVALVTWQAVEIWHHGAIFATGRALTEEAQGLWADLLNCPFCLSLWVGVASVMMFRGDWLLLSAAVAAAVMFALASRVEPDVWYAWLFVLMGLASLTVLACHGQETVDVFLTGLASSRLANLGNDVFRSRCRTPGHAPARALEPELAASMEAAV